MRMLSFDVECTTLLAGNNSHPFDARNKLVYMATYDYMGSIGHLPYQVCSEIFRDYDLYIAFNAKFDMHWVRRETGFIFSIGSIWCCQIAHMVLTRQLNKYPSLNEALERYHLAPKLDIVKTEYWDKGIDTDLIPLQILAEYGDWDARQTYRLAELQIEEAKGRGLYQTIRMSCADLTVLQEMEWNGMKYDVQKSLELAGDADKQLTRLDLQLRDYIGDTNLICNFNSPEHISAILFGGNIKYLVPYVHVFKNGNSKVRHKEEIEVFPRLFNPPRTGKPLKKEGVYSTNKENIALLQRQKLSKKQQKVLQVILERSKIEQLRGTYYLGIPELFNKYNWTEGVIHHTLNQCVAITGRLSSSNPNLQNQSEESKVCFVTRF